MESCALRHRGMTVHDKQVRVTSHGYVVVRMWLMQSETVRKREQDLQKVKKEIEILNVQYESNEQALKKRHQEQLNDLSDQLERANKQKAKYGLHDCS